MLPNPTIPTLSDEQAQISGVTMGEGTSFLLVDFNPWDASDVVASDVALGARPGVVSGFNVQKTRPVSFRVFIAGSPDTKAETQELGRQLRQAMAPTSQDIALHFRISGEQYFLMGRPRAIKADMKRWGAGHLAFDCRFLATDPRIYSASLQESSSTAYSSVSAGLLLSNSAAFFSTVTITNATPAVVSYTGHSQTSGTPVYFTTTGTLPTGITANKQYYVQVVDANSFQLNTLQDNAIADSGTGKVATSSAGSGVHTAILDRAEGWMNFHPTGTSDTATITNASPAVVTDVGHGQASGKPVYFTTTGTLPAGITANYQYYVQVVTADTYKLNYLQDNAVSNLTAGLVASTSAGSGTHTANYFPVGGYLDWGVSSSSPAVPVSAFNSGTVSTPWQASITSTNSAANVNNISITHVETQRKLVLSGIYLVAGSTLYLDSSDHAVLLYSGSNYSGRRNLLTASSTWWDLQVGTNTFQVDVSGGGTATVKLNWYTIEV
jgi:hypothetical protein